MFDEAAGGGGGGGSSPSAAALPLKTVELVGIMAQGGQHERAAHERPPASSPPSTPSPRRRRRPRGHGKGDSPPLDRVSEETSESSLSSFSVGGRAAAAAGGGGGGGGGGYALDERLVAAQHAAVEGLDDESLRVAGTAAEGEGSVPSASSASSLGGTVCTTSSTDYSDRRQTLLSSGMLQVTPPRSARGEEEEEAGSGSGSG